MIYFDYYITTLDTIRRGERGKVPYYSSTILLSPFLLRVSDYKKDYDKLLVGILIVYSYISANRTLYQGILSTENIKEDGNG
jgi:hypothetical protein